ncbi:MAG TPA: hypothetical protein PK640_21405, partial [Verrucomicrobiota bacterium]|nr:hypothetical protein [Verrucomicrobiota bacterium]
GFESQEWPALSRRCLGCVDTARRKHAAPGRSGPSLCPTRDRGCGGPRGVQRAPERQHQRAAPPPAPVDGFLGAAAVRRA